MNRTAIRNFATWARTTLIEQVRSRLHSFGITEKRIVSAQNVAGGIVVNGQTLNGEDAEHYRQLKSLIDHSGLTGAALITKITEEIAYIWFNRLAALRYMEVNGYLSYRSLSSSDPNLVDPDILREVGAIAAAGDFEELDFAKLTVWRELAASQPNPDEWLYRKLLLLQCRDLSKAIACLFDRDKDYTLLFLPPNLLNSDSILKKLVSAIAEEDWLDIEIVGWLYQFYISEKKDEVIGAKSKVKAEDIPAATQLFTPHWIVRYMVENSLGRLWLEAHPESSLREKMPYYLERSPLAPLEKGGKDALQVPLIKGDLGGSLNQMEVRSPLTPLEKGGKDALQVPLYKGDLGGSLTPQDLTVCDPACGSGHILVYAFDLLFEIYREQGYSDREIPALILEHNLFGLDIDDRAVQLASFAILMKARARDKRFLRRVADLPRLNILWVRNTRQFFNEREMAGQRAIADHQMSLGLGLAEQLPLGYVAPIVRGSLVSFLTENAAISGELLAILRAFVDADHLGSLIGPPVFDADRIYEELDRLEFDFSIYRDDFGVLRDVVRQAVFLRRQFRVVVANPPYMGSKGMNDKLKAFAEKNHADNKSDLFSIFIERVMNMTVKDGFIGLMSPFTWMFLSSYEKLRQKILSESTLTSLIRPEYHAFFDSAFVPICAFTLFNRALPEYEGTFIDLKDFYGADLQPVKVLEAIANPDCGYLYHAKASDFGKIPSSAIAYWVSDRELQEYSQGKLLQSYSEPRKGLDTGHNDRFLRLWHEVSITKSVLFQFKEIYLKNNEFKWYPYNKGGEFRRWYGNHEYAINWANNGLEIKSQLNNDKQKPTLRNQDYYFRQGYTWTTVSSSNFSARYTPEGFLFDNGGCTLFASQDIHLIGGFLNSKVANRYLGFISPTLNYQPGDISKLLYKSITDKHRKEEIEKIVLNLISISREDWDNFETSWDFKTHPLTRYKTDLIQQTFENWQKETESAFQQLKQLEEENNRYWIAAYGLQDELTPEVPDEQITIRRADLTRDIKSLLSYAVGCIMGRYALEREGIRSPLTPLKKGGKDDLQVSIQKEEEKKEKEENSSPPFLRGAGGDLPSSAIIPITSQAYFTDDIVDQIIEFLKTAYSPQHLQANLDYIANALTLKTGENSRDRIRRYFLDEFVKDHIQTYKKRPIYWYFTSGKKKAFGALVYLHRYDTTTLARLRTDYVLELQRKLDSEIQREQQNLALLTTTTAKKASQKLIKDLQDQQLELREYQAKLQHAADKRIAIDLDDGVAYNYTLFEGLVYEGAELKMADLKKKSEWKRKNP
ncbi:MAG: BREX-1 system adenine-specific DNA-methyltransferase PglX [Pseudanabaena sp. M38BS1SP1A06MG]|nr:BREX-1 system adenine-specific DNA-methyltransferase PglX [Pseudanabaena sp. M53BS1SP1A06MG]MCA6593936.1 BREX-1 system adenine-specific DNA-methyltransferase PglX [Pseudanabaena sp. M38BS1SP1A06MG]